MLDRDGYRPNVGIILAERAQRRVLGQAGQPARLAVPAGRHQVRRDRPSRRCTASWRRRSACKPEHVRILGRTRHWLRYEVPEHWVRRDWRGTYRGQKQIWYLLRLLGRDCDVRLRGSGKPEFDAWRWHDYWVPLEAVIEFKREVYRQALTELHRFLNADRRRGPPGSGRRALIR